MLVMLGLGNGYDGRNFRFRLPFFFSLSLVLTYCSFLLVPALINSLKLHVWAIFLDFSLFNTVCSQSSSVIKTEGIFLLLHSGIVLCFCLFRLSNTLSELWVSNSHTSWY